MRLSVDDSDPFRLGRVVFGLQCQQCGEEHRIGLNSRELRLMDPSSDPEGASTFSGHALVCAKCGSTGQVTFSAHHPARVWIESG